MRRRYATPVSQEHAVEVIGATRLAALLGCVEAAESRWVSDHLPRFSLPTKSLMATNMNHLVIEELTAQLSRFDGVELKHSPPATRFHAVVDNRLLISFKKVDRGLRTSNYPTPTALAFDQQEVSAEFRAIPRLKVGWAMNAFGTALSGVYLLQAFGKQVSWWMDLRGGEGSLSLAFPTTAPEIPATPRVLPMPARHTSAADLEAEAAATRRRRNIILLADGGDAEA